MFLGEPVVTSSRLVDPARVTHASRIRSVQPRLRLARPAASPASRLRPFARTRRRRVQGDTASVNRAPPGRHRVGTHATPKGGCDRGKHPTCIQWWGNRRPYTADPLSTDARPLTAARLRRGRNPRPGHRRARTGAWLTGCAWSNLLWVAPTRARVSDKACGQDLAAVPLARGRPLLDRKTGRPGEGAAKGVRCGLSSRVSTLSLATGSHSPSDKLGLVTVRAVSRRAALDALERSCHPSRQAEPSVRKITPESALFLAGPRKASWYNNGEGYQHGIGGHGVKRHRKMSVDRHRKMSVVDGVCGAVS